MIEEKTCKKCHARKNLNLFTKNKLCKNGVAGTCKECSNKYSSRWKEVNRDELNQRSREIYKKTHGVEVKKRAEERKKKYPLKCRSQVLRNGMIARSRLNDIEFDSDIFTVDYLMNRLIKNSSCECCNVEFDLGFKKDKKFNNNSPSMDRVDSSKGYIFDNVAILCWGCNKSKQDSTSEKLRLIADFIDSWGDKIL